MKRAFKFFAELFVFGGVLIFATGAAFAGNGKVSGQVFDKKTKEPVWGAGVKLLQNGAPTGLGAVSNEKGNYTILNVPPGSYDIEITFTGYGKQLIKALNVQTDLTADAGQVRLVEEAIQGDTTIVVAQEKQKVRKEITTSQKVVTAEEIQKLPVRNITELLSRQVGVTVYNGQIHVRGGRSGETVYIIDGVEVSNILTGTRDRGQVQSANMSVPTTGVQEFTFIKGGFDAQYGNATSGVVNISTKEGSTDRTRFHVEYFTDRFGSPTLNKYSFNSDQVQLSLSGPEPVLGSIFPKLLKWNTEGKVAYFLSAQMDKTDTYLAHNKLASTLTQKTYPVTRILGLNIPDRMQNTNNLQLKFTVKPSGLLKFNVDWKSEFLRYNYTGSGLVWAHRYSPATAPIVNDRTNTFSISAEHTLSKNSFYRAQISHRFKRFIERPGDPNNPAHGKNPDLFLYQDEFESFSDDVDGQHDPNESFFDANGNGEFDPGERWVDADANGRWDPAEPFLDVFRDDTTRDGKPVYTPPNPATGFPGDPFEDLNGDGVYESAEPFKDTNGNGRFDVERRENWHFNTNTNPPEPFHDGDILLGEPFIDMDKDGKYNPAVDRFITCNCPENQDLNFNSQYDGPTSAYSPGLPFRDLNGNSIYDPPSGGVRQPGEQFVDVNGNGVYDYGNNGFAQPGDYLQQTIYQNSSEAHTTARFDFNSQMGGHYFSSGLQMDLTKLTMADVRYPANHYTGVPDYQAFSGRGIFRDFYVHRPILADVYIGDRVEYGQLIANLSLRYDFFFQASGLNDIRATEVLVQNTVPEPIKNKISPRMGFSYPISERAKVFFNYGHYFQLPALETFYKRTTQGSSAAKQIGNFNLDYTKEINYEFGSEVLLSNNYRAILTGFYKDAFGLVNTQTTRLGADQFSQFINSDYGRTRGVEVELSKIGGGYLQGNLDYSFLIALGKSSSDVSNYLDFLNAREIPIQEFPLDWDQRHQLSLNVNVNVPNGDHPQLFGLKMPDNWNLNFIWSYGSGFPYTPTVINPGVPRTSSSFSRTNALRRPPTSQMDVRFQKSFRVWRQDYSFQLWINNLFDRKNVLTVFENTGRTNTNRVTNITGFSVATLGTPFQNDPRLLGPGRNIKLGLSIDF